MSAPEGQPGQWVPAVRDRRTDRLIRLPAVRERTGLSTPTIYRRQADGTFPKSVRIGANAVAWYESDIDDFVANPFQAVDRPER